MTDGRAATVRTFVRRWSGAIRRPEADRSGDLPLRRNASLVPVASIAGRSLVTVVAIMTFLCALAAGAGLLIAGASRDWQRAVSSEVTIQVRPIGGHDTDAEVQKAADLARATPGIDSVEVYGKKDSEKLLEPWLGTGLNFDELPIPRMLAVKLNRQVPADLTALRQRLESAVAGVSLDDHQVWFGWLATMADTVVLIAACVFALVLAAMFLTVAFATRGAMAGNHEIIDVLHFVGAEDKFIAREFQRHFLRLGLRGGMIGGGGAIVLFLAAAAVRRYLHATPGGDQLESLFGSFALGFRGYAAIVLITLSIAIATGLISRGIVVRNLRRLH
jgi:cell division transport system permease protein